MNHFRTIKNNPGLLGLADMSPDIVYSRAGGKALTLRLLTPWRSSENANCRYPLILFIQGSGWTYPNIYSQILQLGWYARQGYVVATVTHRNSCDGFPFPAFLQDVKCALRYLRAHADEYKIDTERVTVYGSSSGGNTALLLGMTGDDPRYKTEEYAEQSDAVSAVVECFGPTDLFTLQDFFVEQRDEPDFLPQILGGTLDSEDARANAHDMSPLLIAKEGVAYPPTLIVHGDCDSIVPYESQGVRMFEKLTELGCEVSMIRVEGADHEGSFWSDELHDMVRDFIHQHMKK